MVDQPTLQFKHEGEPYPRCRACKNKMIFPTAQAADEAILRAKLARELRGVRKRKETRRYLCPAGQGYHITSWETPGRPTPTGEA